MKWKESNTVFRPSLFPTSQFWLQAFVVFSLLSIGFSNDAPTSTKSSTVATTAKPHIENLFDQPSLHKEIKCEGKEINFVLYPPTDKDCIDEVKNSPEAIDGDAKNFPKFDFQISGCESLDITWIYVVETKRDLKIGYKLDKENKFVNFPGELVLPKDSHFLMSILRNEGKIKVQGDGEPEEHKFICKGDISGRFNISYSTEKKCGARIELSNCDYYTPPPPPVTTKSTTFPPPIISTSSVSTTTSSANPKTTTAPVSTVLGLATWLFVLIICISALVVLLIVGLLVYFLWWRKRKAAKENDIGPVPVGMKPETWQKIKNMKPKEFPLTEKQKQIKAGAMADEKEYPTEVSQESDWGPVQKTEIVNLDKKKKKEENTQSTSQSTTTKTNEKSTKTDE